MSEEEQIKFIIKQNMNNNGFNNSISSIIKNTKIQKLTIYEGNLLVAFLFYCNKIINYRDKIINAYTVGLVNTRSSHQYKGYGKSLLNNLKLLAEKNNIDIIYLQGIKNFYNKIGYKKLNNKTKILINTKQIELDIKFKKNSILIRSMYADDLEIIKILYEDINENYNLTAVREIEEWNNLYELRNTFLFYKPKIIEYEKNIIGYYTTDIKDKNVIKEFILKAEASIIKLVIFMIAKKIKIDTIEICIDKDNKIYKNIEKNIDFEYLELNRPFSSNLYLPINKNFKRVELGQKINGFIYQGDNL